MSAFLEERDMTPRPGTALLALLTFPALAGALAACDDGDGLAPLACSDFVSLGSDDGRAGVFLWDGSRGEVVYDAPESRVDPVTALDSARDRLAFVHGGKLHLVSFFTGEAKTVDYDGDATLLDWVGERLVLAAHGRIDLVDTATLARTTLVDGDTDVTALHLSPDGQTVGFVRGVDLLALPVAGGEPVELVDAPVGDFFGWSFDGAYVAYLTPLAHEIRVVHLARAEVSLLGDSALAGAAWSPTAARLLYEHETLASTPTDAQIELALVDADGSHPLVLDIGKPHLATWSADGANVVWHGRPADLTGELGANPLVTSGATEGGDSRLLHHDWPERAYQLAECAF
jgi:hypothetical protein